jgi:4-coumarate--CoA ligase
LNSFVKNFHSFKMATFDSDLKVWEGQNISYGFSHNTSIGAELLKKLSETPDRILNICHDDETSVTCRETRLASIRIAQNLTKLGFTKGDVFGFMCSNSTQLPAVLYGSIMIGAPVNPLDIGFKKDDIKHIFEQTRPKLVFCDHEVYEAIKLSLDEMESNAKIITLREPINGVTFVDELLTTTGNEDSFE